MLAALTSVAAVANNNLLYLVISVLSAIFLVGLPLGSWNMRGISASRSLPPDLFAGTDPHGRLLLENRSSLPGIAIQVADPHGEVHLVDIVPTHGQAQTPCRFRFSDRGVHRLAPLRVSSAWPFGLVEHVTSFDRQDEVVVYPNPIPAPVVTRMGIDAGISAATRGRGQGGEHHGTRSYRPGDRPSCIHWPTTARADDVMVVQRVGEAEAVVEVELRWSLGRTWEHDIGRAAGQIVRCAASGVRVGLRVPALPAHPARAFRPDRGARWRRTLLDALARLPRAHEVKG